MRKFTSKSVRRQSALEKLESRQLFAILVVPSSYPTIQSAVNASHAGDTIQLGYGAASGYAGYTTTEQVYIGPGHNNLTIQGTDHLVAGGPVNDFIQAPGVATPQTYDPTKYYTSTPGSYLLATPKTALWYNSPADAGASADPNFVPGALIEVSGSTGVTITGITIEGPGTVSAGIGTNNLIYGAYVTNAGSLTLSSDTVTNIHNQDPNFLNHAADGFAVDVAWGGGTLSSTNVTAFQKAGIYVGNPYGTGVTTHTATASITSCTVDSLGFHSLGVPTGENINGQVGIEFALGGGGTVSNTTVNNITDQGNAVGGAYTDTGIVVFDAKAAGVTITNGSITNCDTGLLIDGGVDLSAGTHGASKGTSVTGTTITGSNQDGIDMFDAKSCTLKNLNVNHNQWDGVFIDPASTANKFTSDTFSSNGLAGAGFYDIEDETNSDSGVASGYAITGTSNTYTSDIFTSFSPW